MSKENDLKITDYEKMSHEETEFLKEIKQLNAQLMKELHDSVKKHQKANHRLQFLQVILMICLICLVFTFLLIILGMVGGLYPKVSHCASSPPPVQLPINMTEIANVVYKEVSKLLDKGVDCNLPSNSGPNITQLADDITQKLSQTPTNSTECAQNVVRLLNNSTQPAILNVTYLADYVAQNVFQLLNENTLASNYTTEFEYLINTTGDLAQILNNVVTSLSSLKTLSNNTQKNIDDILIKIEELHNGSVLYNSIRPVSCQDIIREFPNSSSGFYHINSQIIYCNMDELCGSGGGWTRLAYLNMSDATVNCPSGLEVYNKGIRSCGRVSTLGPSCDSVKFETNGIGYSSICGRAVGYQKGLPNAVNEGIGIDSWYTDGVSITHGSPRQHVWTLMVGAFSNISNANNCPCANGSVPQSFIGNDYFCESGNDEGSSLCTIALNDPLWDGQGCGSYEDSCCTAHASSPWFYRSFNVTTTEYIELRICGNDGTDIKDVKLSTYEVYIK